MKHADYIQLFFSDLKSEGQIAIDCQLKWKVMNFRECHRSVMIEQSSIHEQCNETAVRTSAEFNADMVTQEEYRVRHEVTWHDREVF
jgi:hypothetical protein